MDVSTGIQAAQFNQQHERKNFRLGILNGSLVRLGGSLIDPNLVIAAFILKHTGSNTLVGLAAALTGIGVFLPQLYVSKLVEHRPLKKPTYIALTIIRLVMLFVMIASMWFIGHSKSSWCVALFLTAMFFYRGAEGSGAMPFFDIVGKTIRQNKLGRFFGWRSMIGDGLSLLGGYFLVQPVLNSYESPTSYMMLAGGAFLILAVAWGSFWCTTEIKDHSPPRKRGLLDTITETAQVVKEDRNYRLLFFFRILMRFNGLLLVFYVSYGEKTFNAIGISGVMLSMLAISKILSSTFWGKISDLKGNRACMTGGAVFLAASPVILLVARHLPTVFSLTIPNVEFPLDMQIVVYLLSLFSFGFGVQATMIGMNSLLIEIAPPSRRPSYIAFLNTITSPLALLPSLAGILIDSDLMSLETLFIVIVVTGSLSFVSVSKLKEVRQPAEEALE